MSDKLSEKIRKAHIEFDVDKRKEVGYIITYNQFEELEVLENQVNEEIKIANAQAKLAREKDQIYGRENSKVAAIEKQVKELKVRRDNYFEADMAQQHKIKALEKQIEEFKLKLSDPDVALILYLKAGLEQQKK